MELEKKRYIAFAYPMYYPSGGMSDAIGSYDTVQEAVDALRESMYTDYREIFDVETFKVIDLDDLEAKQAG